MKHFKGGLVCLLLAAILAVTATSCGNNKQQNTEKPAPTSSTVSEPEQQKENDAAEGPIVQNTVSSNLTVEDENYVYYINHNDGGTIYRLDKQSKSAEQWVAETECTSLYLADDGKLFFTKYTTRSPETQVPNTEGNGSITVFSVESDGSGLQQYAGGCEQLYYVTEDSYYFLNYLTYTLDRYDFATQELHTVLEQAVPTMCVTPYGIFYAQEDGKMSMTSLDDPFASSQPVYIDGSFSLPFYSDGTLYFVGTEIKEPAGSGAEYILYNYDAEAQQLAPAVDLSGVPLNLYLRDGTLYIVVSNEDSSISIETIALESWEQSTLELPEDNLAQTYFFTQDYIAAYERISLDPSVSSSVSFYDYQGASLDISGSVPDSPTALEPPATEMPEKQDLYVLDGSGQERYNWIRLSSISAENLQKDGITVEAVQDLKSRMEQQGYSAEDIATLDVVIQRLQQIS